MASREANGAEPMATRPVRAGVASVRGARFHGEIRGVHASVVDAGGDAALGTQIHKDGHGGCGLPGDVPTDQQGNVVEVAGAWPRSIDDLLGLSVP